MKPKELTELTNEELLQQAKKNKSIAIYDAVIIGLLIGIAIYSVIKTGFGLFTFMPLAYIPIANKNRIKSKELENLLKERNLK